MIEDALSSRKNAAQRSTNEYEIKLIKALSSTENIDIFQ